MVFSGKSRLLAVLAAGALLSGCATAPGSMQHDPLEPFNRAMHGFNETVDKAVVKPVAEGYRAVAPDVVRTGLRNFFSNIGDVVVLLNDLLQFKFEQAASDFSRLVWNSSVGVFGLIDVASHMDLPKHNEDFGQTLGYWGVKSGPYLVLPFFGPSSVRDTAGLVVDIKTDPVNQMGEVDRRNTAIAVRVVVEREALLDVEKAVDEAALDKYQFVRDGYLQRRHSLVHDGNPPDQLDLTQEVEAAPAP